MPSVQGHYQQRDEAVCAAQLPATSPDQAAAEVLDPGDASMPLGAPPLISLPEPEQRGDAHVMADEPSRRTAGACGRDAGGVISAQLDLTGLRATLKRKREQGSAPELSRWQQPETAGLMDTFQAASLQVWPEQAHLRSCGALSLSSAGNLIVWHAAAQDMCSAF